MNHKQQHHQISTEQNSLFKNGSTTYWTSSLFFPKSTREDITVLYAFVRKADNFVDSVPQDKAAFLQFKETYENTVRLFNKNVSDWQSGDQVIDDFILLADRYKFDPVWTNKFLAAMQDDTEKAVYKNIDETEKYMYGSAEVVGLFMSKMFGLPQAAYQHARALGRAMQYINFIRDVKEDVALGRQYLPANEIPFSTGDLVTFAAENPKAFIEFIHEQLRRYERYQHDAEKGYHYIPRKYRIPIKTAGDMYNWTARQIYKNPLEILERKIKPSKLLIVLFALKNFFTLL